MPGVGPTNPHRLAEWTELLALVGPPPDPYDITRALLCLGGVMYAPCD